MAEEGRGAFTLARFARLIWVPPEAIRRHFIDMDSLLYEILMAHLLGLAKAVGAVPADAPDPLAARRAAYLAYTRSPWGNLTEDHLLLVRDLSALAPDDRQALWDIHRGIGDRLGGTSAANTLQLLDFAGLERHEIKGTLAKRVAAHAAANPASRVAPPAHAAPVQLPEPARVPAAHTSPQPEPAPIQAPPAPPPPRSPGAPPRKVRKLLPQPGRQIVGIGSRLRKPFPPRPTLLDQRPGCNPPPEPNPFPSLIERVLKSQSG
jgi:AcrR family transcriptional regulator